MKFFKQSIAAFLFTVLIVACSGSDSGLIPVTPANSSMAQIDTSNAVPIAREVVDAVFAGSKPGDILGGGGSGSLAGKTEYGLAKTGSSQGTGLLGYISSVPIVDTTTACALEGSVTISGEVADPITLSADDQILLQFFDCDDGAGQVLNGVYAIGVNAFSGDLLQGLVHLSAIVTLNGFEITEGLDMTSMDGDVTLDLDTTAPPMTGISVSGNSLSISDNTDTATLTSFRTDVTHDAGVAPEAYTSTASGMLTSTLFEGDVNYSTPIPFMGYVGENPFAGELLVTGADGASVRLFALDNVNVRLEIDQGDGSGIVSEATTWGQVAGPVVAVGTGIRGLVLRGPINPGPEVVGVSNEAPFSATFGVLDSDNNTVARFVSDDSGAFEVVLPPGDYTVVPGASAPVLFPEQQPKAVTVPEDGFADVVLQFDTGIR